MKVRCSDCNSEIESAEVIAHEQKCDQRGRDAREREIRDLGAGLELDALIAERFMGGECGPYSTQNTAAHKLLERLLVPRQADGLFGTLDNPTVSVCYHHGGKVYVAVNPGGLMCEKSAYGPFPLALCQAAIMADENVGRTVDYHARRYPPTKAVLL